MFGFGGDKEKNTVSVPRVEVGFLGKLETRPDFLKYCSDSREVAVMDMCLRDWMLMQSNSGVSYLQEPLVVGFLLVGGLDRQGLSGYLFSSQDSHGRKYPFFYFARWADIDLYFKPAPLFFGSGNIFEQADSTLYWPLRIPAESALQELKSSALLRHLPSGKRLMSESMSAMTDMNFEQWLTALVGSDVSIQKASLAGWHAQILYYFSKHFNSDLKLPLGDTELAPHSILFWLHLISGLAKPAQWRPDIIWTVGKSFSLLNILAKPITASRLDQLVHAKSGKEGYSIDITVVASDQDLKWAEQLLIHKQRLLLDVAISWSQML